MRLIRGVHNLDSLSSGCVATIGNFDGVHLGHQELIKHLDKKKAELGLPSLVMLFEPQPLEFFQPETAPPRLMTLRDKVEALRDCGVDYVLCVNFDQKFRSLTAAQFVQEILIDGIQVRHLVIGDDFRFGGDRTGDFHYLKKKGEEFNFSVVSTPSVKVDDIRVSSTQIRAFMSKGDFASAERFLGRPFTIAGKVVYGDQIGRTIDVPTANISSKRQKLPVAGVFAVTIEGVDGNPRFGVGNVGRRPTVNGLEDRIEIHLLDYQGDLYGKRLTIRFRKKIRDEKKFDGLPALKAAISNDIAEARSFFSNEASQNQ